LGLVLCADCKGIVSDAARACPRCGAPRPERARKFLDVSARPIFLILLALSAGVAYASMRLFVPPQQIVDQSVRLREGECVTYDMRGDATLHVEVNSVSKPVDVVIAERNPIETACKPTRDGASSGGYSVPLISRRRVRTLVTNTRLPSGHFGLTVMRPKESLLFEESAQVSIRVARD